MKTQMTFKRTEFKYLLTRSQYDAIIDEIKKHTHTDLFSKGDIMSIYFETESKTIISNALSHPIYKEKLRLRSYGVPKDNDEIYIELKNKYDGCCYKRRIAIKASEVNANYGLSYRNSQIANEIKKYLERYPSIKPSIMIMYRRMAYYDNLDATLRITFDSNVIYRDTDLDLRKGVYGDILLDPNLMLMEIKTSQNMPLWLVRILNENKIYRTKYSKYNNAYLKLNDKEQLADGRVV